MNVHRVLPLFACFLWLWAPPLPAQDRSPDRQEDESAQEDEGKSQQEILAERRREKAENLSPYRVSGAEERLIRLEAVKFPLNIFERGLHGIRPLIGGMPSGSGFVGGVGYVNGLEDEYLRFEANARFSTRNFREYDLNVEWPPPQNDPLVRLYATGAYQDYVGLRFFGLGNDSSSDNTAKFGQLNQLAGGGIAVEPERWVRFYAEATRLEAEADSGTQSPALDTVFDPSTIPGFGTSTDYNVYGGRFVVDLTSEWTVPKVGSRSGSKAGDTTMSLSTPSTSRGSPVRSARRSLWVMSAEDWRFA